MPDLLPHNATEAERALSCAVARVSVVPVPIRSLWDADTCPEDLLPWLAWAVSVDDWSASWSVADKREVIRRSLAIHRIKGTVSSVDSAVRAAGYRGFTIVERAAGDHWAEYRIYLTQPISILMAAKLRAILRSIAPVRCSLKELNFTEAAHLHDRTINYDGTFSYGVA